LTKTLFLEIEHDTQWALASVGPAYIAACLKRAGHETSLLPVPLEMTTRQIMEKIIQESPDVLGISLASRQWLRAAHVVEEINQHFTLPIIAGSLHPTFNSDLMLDTPVMFGECRWTTLLLSCCRYGATEI